MSAILRSVSLSMASAAAVGFVLVVGPAPTAHATPCGAPRQTSTLPPRSRRCPRLSRSCSRRLGAGPVTRMTSAPLPRLGPLISSLLAGDAGAALPAPVHPRAEGPTPGPGPSAPLQQQAEVLPPAPNPPAPAVPQLPNANPLRPNAAPVPQPQRAGPAASVDRGRPDVPRRLGHRAGRPQQNAATFRHLRHRPRDCLGQRRSRQPPGADGLR